MKKHFELLGYVVRDVVSGFEGVVDSICFDLYGCVQASVRPTVDPAKRNEFPDGRWFDTKRLKRISETPVMELPTFDVVPGPASKPAFRNGPLG